MTISRRTDIEILPHEIKPTRDMREWRAKIWAKASPVDSLTILLRRPRYGETHIEARDRERIRIAQEARELSAREHKRLADITKKHRGRVLVRTIIEHVSVYYGVSVDDIKSASREVGFVHARHMAMFLAKTMTEVSYPDLSRLLNRRNHTTSMHAVRKISRGVLTDGSVKKEWWELYSLIHGNEQFSLPLMEAAE